MPIAGISWPPAGLPDLTHPFHRLAAALKARRVRYVVIGVGGANYWATTGAQTFATEDFDLFLPREADNLLRAWEASDTCHLSLLAGDEPLDSVRDRLLAERVVAAGGTTRATDGGGFDVDLSLTMAGFDFETVWAERQIFLVEGVDLPVARLRHIIESKARAGRPKDRLFLATHAEALRQLLGDPREEP